MYNLEKFTFKTKKEMQDYVRSVVYSLGESVIKPDNPHFTLFKDIIKKENIIELKHYQVIYHYHLILMIITIEI